MSSFLSFMPPLRLAMASLIPHDTSVTHILLFIRIGAAYRKVQGKVTGSVEILALQFWYL